MKNILILLVLMVGLHHTYAQHKPCRCNNAGALLIPQGEKVPLYKKSDGKTIKWIIENDTITEDYCSLTIKKIQGDFALISAWKPLANIRSEGWIPLKYLGIRPAVYSGELYLYEKPDRNSKINSTIIDPEWAYYQILDCCDKWLYVVFSDKGVVYEGWMDPKDQCDNPYSTCN